MSQNKAAEIAFFDEHSAVEDYQVFPNHIMAKLVDACLVGAKIPKGGRVLDIGCGTGVFTKVLQDRGYCAEGLDISPGMIERARAKYPQQKFHVGDCEALPYADGELDGILFSCILHHFSDPTRALREGYRVLKPGGYLMAFDPNAANPFMFLYRHPSSPLYSSVGVTSNEKPLFPRELELDVASAGFQVELSYLNNVTYQYIASKKMMLFLSVYNWMDRVLFAPNFMRPFRPFVITSGVKRGPVALPGKAPK